MSINKVILIGRLGADPEIKTFQSGDKVANIRVATSERWKDKQTGEKKERTEWHSVAVFGPLADVVERYTKKGDEIYLEGQLQTRKWQDQSGQDRYTTEIVLRGPSAKVNLLGGGGQRDGNQGGERQNDAGQRQGGMNWNESDNGPGRGGSTGNGGPRGQRGFADDLDDDIPFISAAGTW